MSSGHHRHFHYSTGPDPDDKRWVRFNKLVDAALKNPKVKAWLGRPFEVVTTFDMAYLGSSSIGGARVFLDQHLHAPGKPVGVVEISGKMQNVRPPLIRHERFEQCVEDVLGYPYLAEDPDDPGAHVLATIYEHRIVPDPRAYEQALRPFIKADDHEKLVHVPGDIDLRPVLCPPVDRKLLERIKHALNEGKSPHDAADVRYQENSPYRGAACGYCSMFVKPVYGGPGCTGVRDDVTHKGFCKRFDRGVLGERRKAA